MDLDAQTVLIIAIVGVVAGWLAVVVTGGGIFRYVAAGITGAIVGKLLLDTIHVGLPIGSALAMQVANAAIGALIMVAVTRVVAGM